MDNIKDLIIIAVIILCMAYLVGHRLVKLFKGEGCCGSTRVKLKR